MNNKDKDKLRELLTEWFNDVNLTSKNIFNQNEIARLIKREITKIGYWDNKPRGIPRSADKLNKDKTTKKEKDLKDKEELRRLKETMTCKCGCKIITKEVNGKRKFECSDFFCELV